MRVLILIFIFMGLNGCSGGLLVYELVNSSQFIEYDHENTPMLNVKYYYDQKKDKSHMYPKPKSEFKPKKEK